MKLQSYTLDINKTLVEERIQILSDVPTKEGVSILEVKDDLNLREDIQTMIENTDLKTTMENDETLGKDINKEANLTEIENNAEETNDIEKEENISMIMEDSENKQEVVEEEPSKKSKRKKKDDKKTVALDLEN